jgi:succinoglycan biosynthesis protein ExoV
VKLFYYSLNNFGDALNAWLWPQLLPDTFNEDERTLFVGIGSLLNQYLPRRPGKVIFGTGVGYGNKQIHVDHTWQIYCVRGPLSAQALNISPALAVTDGATLLRLLNLPQQAKQYSISFMPHWRSAEYWDWQYLCNQIGLHFIDPASAIETVIQEIQKSELLITEALHGAITADAMRVPWVPVRAYKHILPFKWQDWCQSVQLDYKPIRLPPLYNDKDITLKLYEWLHLSKQAASPYSLLAQMLTRSTRFLMGRVNKFLSSYAVRSLETIVKYPAPFLSTEQVLESVTTRLEERLEQFKDDYSSGRLKGILEV